MKKLLCLLFITSSIFSMRLDVVRAKKQSAIRREIKIKSASNSTTKQICPMLHSKDKEHVTKDSGNITKEVSKPESTQHYPIGEKNLSIPQRLGNIFLYHYNREFYIVRNSNVFPIKHCFMDKELRGISKEKLESLIAEDVYLSINSVGNDDYSLKLNGRVNGGGFFGAPVGFGIGKCATLCIGHGVIFVTAALTGPAFPSTFAALEGALAMPLESASNVGGVIGGIVGAFFTGQV